MSKPSDAMREFLNGCHYATLASFNDDGSIHLTPAWYLFEEERFFMASAAADRKVRNVLARPNVSLLVDSRRHQGSERWVSASGMAEILRGEQSEELNSKIQQRYLTKAAQQDARVGPAFAAASEVTIAITPVSWRSYDFKSMDEQFFAGILGETPEKWFRPVD